MTLRTGLLPAIDRIRAVLGPSALDLRPTSIAVVTRTWAGPRRAAPPGNYVEKALALPAYTKVRHVTQREIAASGGRYEQGDVIIGPITPFYAGPPSGGFTEAQLAPSGSQGVEIIYRLALQSGATGIAGDNYLVEFKRDRVFRFMLVVGRLRSTPGF